jgi:hypothetical protein
MTTPTLNEAAAYAAPAAAPDCATFIAVLILLSVLTILAGAGAVWGGIEDKSDMEGFGGLAVFFAGLFLSAATFALRKLQLIEWRLAQGSNQRR